LRRLTAYFQRHGNHQVSYKPQPEESDSARREGVAVDVCKLALYRRGVLFPESGRIEPDEQTIDSVCVAHESPQKGFRQFRTAFSQAHQVAQADGFGGLPAPPRRSNAIVTAALVV
jgi:sulfur relay (sulfurtransferase) complex TusBCD TusD component (DsrE family)